MLKPCKYCEGTGLVVEIVDGIEDDIVCPECNGDGYLDK